MPKIISKSLLLLLALPLAGCVSPYRADVQQGNALSAEALAKLEPNMTKRQVRALLGTPLVTDPFRQDRWDYVFTQRNGHGPTERQRLTLQFRNDQLVGVDGDLAPPHLRHKSVSSQ
jgi:outer membrane protein assembly factor BamE